MVNGRSRIKNILGIVTVGVLFITYYGYSKYEYARSISEEIEALPALLTDKLSLQTIHKSDKNFTLRLKLSGVTPTTEHLDKLKSYYDNVALNYVCKTSSFDSQFEDGYQISFDIKYSVEPNKTFKQIYISKGRCLELTT